MNSDVGRPLPRLKLKIDVRKLEEMMLQVMQEVQLRNHRVQDNDGLWCTLRITPYRTLDNRIDGAVLVVVNVESPDAGEQAKDSATVDVPILEVKKKR